MSKMKILFLFFTALAISFFGCQKNDSTQSITKSKYPLIQYDVISEWNDDHNIDSPALWMSPDGSNSFIIATSKAKHNLFVYNATDLKLLKQVGKKGKGPLEFERPNGVWVLDNYLFVCERDNHRIQVISLPDFTFVGFVGENQLIRPYGLSVVNKNDYYSIFITDQFEVENHIYPPYYMLNQRVQHFDIKIQNNTIIEQNLENSFGDTLGQGQLIIVESIFADPEHNRLLIADEDKNQNVVKIYDMTGNYLQQTLGGDLIQYQAEGIMMYDCVRGEGYYFLTDQDFYKTNNNTFHVYNRRDLKYVGSFISDKIQNTDGIWITNQKLGMFEQGVLIAVNDDGGVGIIDIKKIFKALNIECK
jgi:3-phytase